MSAWPFVRLNRTWITGWMLLAAGTVQGQELQTPPPSPYAARAESDQGNGETIVDPNVQPAGCSTCGGGLLKPGHGGCSSCGGGLFNIPPAEQLGGWGTGDCGYPCYPGRRPCDCGYHEAKTCLGRMCKGVYHCICCPDPCYDPQWLGVADSAFFVDAARPKTQMKLRWDTGFDFRNPDRAEYFWAREGVQQVDAGGAAVPGLGKGPPLAERTITRYKELRLINEAAADAAGFFIELPYLRVEPEFNDDHAGFGDLAIGTKSMLLDCALLQITFQFTTYIPTAAANKGLGTGHVSLDPALLWALKLTPSTYLQAETGYWIPIGGDPFYQGDVFHYGFSLNQILWCCGKANKDYQLIGTVEFNGWSVMDGAFTDADILIGGDPVALEAVTHMAAIGPGLRFFVCDKIDIGVGAQFAITANQWADSLYRAEFRWRF